MPGADIGIPQLAMHSACESMAISDYEVMVKGLSAYFATSLKVTEENVYVE
jgi:aspartyl aminopeptidase